MIYDYDMTSINRKKEKEPNPLMLSDVKFITTQLVDFIKFYTENFAILDDDTKRILDELTVYAELLNQKRYDKLFVDTSLIKNDTFDNDQK